MSKYKIGQYVRRSDIDPSQIAQVVAVYPGHVVGRACGTCYAVDFGDNPDISFIFAEEVLWPVEVRVGDRVGVDAPGDALVLAVGDARNGRKYALVELDDHEVVAMSYRDIF